MKGKIKTRESKCICGASWKHDEAVRIYCPECGKMPKIYFIFLYADKQKHRILRNTIDIYLTVTGGHTGCLKRYAEILIITVFRLVITSQKRLMVSEGINFYQHGLNLRKTCRHLTGRNVSNMSLITISPILDRLTAGS